MIISRSTFNELRENNKLRSERAIYLGIITAIFIAVVLIIINTVSAASTKQWPASNDWTQETLTDKSANLITTATGLTMTPPGIASNVTPSVIATGLDTPWAMRFAPSGKLFITERPGRVRVFENNVLNPTPVLTISGTETLSAEEGLQGMALDPDFGNNGYMYLYYTYSPGDGSMKNRVARYTVSGNTTVGTPVTLVDAIPGSRFHNGGRIAFGPDGKLYIATGAADVDAAAQDLNSTAGKILRINPDGTIPADNPFPGLPVYSLGHRNPQGLAWHPETGKLWSTEHGPTGTPPFCCHDEVNIIEPGANYGWPKHYASLTNSTYSSLNVVNPVYPVYESGDGKWAPGGAIFYRGDQLGGPWKNSLIFAGLGFQNAGGRALYRLGLNVDNTTPTSLDSLFVNQYGRLRDVVEGPGGDLYLATSNRDGRGQPIAEDDRIVKLTPTIDSASSTATGTLTFDAGSGSTADWGSIVSETTTPTGTSVTFQSRSSTDGTTYSAYTSDIPSSPNGRFIQIKITLTSNQAGVVPSVSNLSLNYDPVTAPPPPPVSFCSGSTAAVCEDFTSNAANFTPTGGTWTVSNGKYVLTNPLTTSSGVVHNRSIHKTSVGSNFVASAKVTMTPSSSTSNDIAFIFGYTNSTNYWSVSLAENNSSGNHGLFRIVNNAWTQVADITTSGSQLIDGLTYDIRLERTGTMLKIYRNNVLVLTTIQSTMPASGSFGLGSINDAASFDELVVTETATPPPPPPPVSFCSGSTAAVCEDFTSSAANFTRSAGTWNVSGGKYVLTNPATSGSGVYNRAIHNKSITGNFTATAKLTPTTSSSTANDVALLFAYTNSTNYWFVSLAENNSTGNHGLFRVVNGTFTQVVDFTSTYQIRDATTYDVKLVRSGNTLTIFRNNVQVANTTQSTLPATGTFGLGSINDPASFDELVVTQP